MFFAKFIVIVTLTRERKPFYCRSSSTALVYLEMETSFILRQRQKVTEKRMREKKYGSNYSMLPETLL